MFLDTRHQGTFDGAGWCADYNEPTSFLNTMLSNSSMNTAHYKSPAFDSIMAETLKSLTRRSAQLCTLKQNNSWIRIRPLFLFITT